MIKLSNIGAGRVSGISDLQQEYEGKKLGDQLVELAQQINNQKVLVRLKREGFNPKPELRASLVKFTTAEQQALSSSSQESIKHNTDNPKIKPN